MSKFNMFDLLSNNSREVISSNEKEDKFKTVQINIKDLVASPNNFYSVDEERLSDLKDSIELLGLQQNLVVKKIKDKYEIIAGHRRYLALKALYKEGKEKFEYVPCKIEEEDYIKNELRLLMTNSTARELTDWEKVNQAKVLKELLTEYKKREKLPGRIREIVADILNTSQTQIARMESISNNLIDEFKEELKEENVKISAAYELSKLPEEKQKEIYKEHEEKENISIKDIKEKAEEKPSEVLKGQITVEEALNIDKEALNIDKEAFEVKEDKEIVLEDEKSVYIVDNSTGEVIEEIGKIEYKNKLLIDLENANDYVIEEKLVDLLKDYIEVEEIKVEYDSENNSYIRFESKYETEGEILIKLTSEGIEINSMDHYDCVELYNNIILIAH